jgi:4-aminobutyrate aminotransferase-like enzyme
MKAMLENGLITDPFFFMPNAFRIAPPLIISKEEIELTLDLLILGLREI